LQPRQSLVVHLTVASNQITGFIICDRLTDCIGLTRLTLFTFVTAYLPLRRALTCALRLQPSSSLPSERTIGRVGLTPTSHMTLRGAPQMTPALPKNLPIKDIRYISFSCLIILCILSPDYPAQFPNSVQDRFGCMPAKNRESDQESTMRL